MNTRSVFKAMVWVGLMSLASIGLAAEGVWTRKADMPTARSCLAACAVDGKVYAIGGGRPSAVLYSTVEQYDPATDTWTKKASMPTPRTTFGLSVVNGKIYVIGGGASGGVLVSIVEEYDPVADTWTTKASMPTARAFLSCAVAAGKIYAIGGLHSGSSCSPVVEEYDPATDTWTRKADTPKPRSAASCSTVGGVIYLVGGAPTGGQGTDRAEPTVQAYDPATDTWTTKAPMTTARCFLSTCVVNDKIYAIGGCLNAYDSSDLSSGEVYDPATDSWRKMADMQVKRKGLGSAVVNGKIYAIGGVSHGGWDPALASVEEYDPNPLVVDFTGDGIVDMDDLLNLIESWGQNDPICDIGPQPFGDGIVDEKDLEVLMGYWGQEVDDPTLIAHWALDEAEGPTAYDSAGQNDAAVIGVPAWLPAGGMIGGALELDGATFLAADSALSPSDGPFSVFGWVQGGAPGQAIVSQAGGVNWLMADPSQGALATKLVPPVGRTATPPLVSEAVITDGDWHRVAFVGDGVTRALYVDDALVAEDAQSGLASCSGGLNIGCDKGGTPGAFWTGLIDEVRIYTRAVKP